MKYNFHIILLCLAAFTFNTGCEKTTLQHEQTSQTSLQYRGDCDECPNSNQCCCGISLHPSTSLATILVCGSTSGFSTCTKTGCSGFNGVAYTLNLDSTTPKRPFCALVSGPFWIQNVTGVQVRILITCQNDEAEGDTIDITLEDGEFRYFLNNGNCEIGGC